MLIRKPHDYLLRSSVPEIWLFLKYALLINIYLTCYLHTTEAYKDHGECDQEHFMMCRNGKCVSKAFVCDGENDCSDGTDEENCSDPFGLQESGNRNDGCDENSFQCLDGMCIPNHWVCDGSTDCLDHSDESFGCNNTVACDDGFRCKSRVCIPLDFVCDGDADCEDSSDEENCPTFDATSCNINNKRFLCNDRKKCLKLQDVCNNRVNCLDGSDEGAKCSEPKNCSPLCTNGHQCFMTPLKALCICPEGHADQNGFCRDINECEEFGVCDHKCFNTIGSYYCTCSDGYVLQKDGKTCKVGGGEGFLLFSSEHEIRAYYLESKVYYPVSKNISHANGIAYDGHFVYWSNIEAGKESIVRAVEDGSNIEILVDFGLGTPENIALDWITGNIYFTDSQMQHIGVCTKTGIHCMILHKDGLDNPRALALYPARGLLFWSDWGMNVRSIIKSGMDGSARTDFVNTDINWPNGITIDFGTDRLYWADANIKRIESILLDGTDRKVIISEPVDHPFSITVFENTLYWSDWKGNQILSCNKFNGKNQTSIIKKHDSQIYNLYIFHSSIQSKTLPNPCLLSKCSHLCLLTPQTSQDNSTSCACPQDMELTQGKAECEMKKEIDAIFVTSGTTVTKIQYNKIGKRQFIEHSLDSVAVLGDIVYNAYDDSLIISDLYKHRIASFSLKKKTISTVYESNDELFTKMDHDPIANNLYWIDGKTKSMNVMNLNKMVKTVIIPSFGEDEPTDFELIPEMGIMFVSLHKKNGPNHIDRYFMDGTSRFHFIEKGLIGPTITLKYDPLLHRLFYADQGAGQILSTSVDLMDRHIFRDHLPGPVSLTSHGNYLFWSNYGSDQVFWANKFQTEIVNSVTTISKKSDVMQLFTLKAFEIINNTTCHYNNGGCSHLCLLREKSQVCACPSGMILDASGLTCVTKITCNDNQYTCNSGECIKKDMVCNRIQDCQSGDDEENCIFTTEAPLLGEPENPACPLDYFFCLDNSGCLPNHQVCDTYSDCADASDELHCSRDRQCSTAEFTCKSGECIPSTWRCDDRLDCKDSSDENDCKSNTCNPETEFRCTSGNCIPMVWYCDSEFDCPDMSDEHNCEHHEKCKKGMFACLNHKCVDEKLECDGFDDCGDNSDEVHCKNEVMSNPDLEESILPEERSIYMCNATHFTCSGLSKSCIPLSSRCNGVSECTYSEDEMDCNECVFGFFECKKIKECIPEVWVCDGMTDCDDKSDEDETLCMNKETHQEQIKINVTKHCDGIECKDSKECIPFFKVCDKRSDCKDHSDEMGLCGSGCSDAKCSHFCRESPFGAQCDCNDGYKLGADGRSCMDINECAIPTTCSQDCHNTLGSFFCTCLTPYYQLRDDRRRCKATGKEMEFVYLTERDIRMTSESLSTVQVLHKFKSPTIIDGMDINVKGSRLYWTSRHEGTISILSTSDSAKLEVRSGFENVGSLAVEWITGNIYVVDNWNIIKLCDSKITVCTEIYKGPLDSKITALALDPLQGILFWSETKDSLGISSTSLKKSLMTGKMVENVLKDQKSLMGVSDMTFNIVNKWLYYSDLSARSVGRINYNGTKQEVLYMVTEPPSNIGLFEDHVYLAMKSSKQSLSSKSAKYGVIEKCGSHSGLYGDCIHIRLLPSSSKDVVKRLRISHQSLQFEVNNYCGDTKCDGICVSIKSKGLCLCDKGIFAQNGSCPNMVRLAETIEQSNEDEDSKSGHTGIVICVLLALLTICGILVAVKFKKLTIPDHIYGRASSKVMQLKSFKFKSFDNRKSFQFDNFKNELTEELIPETDEYNNPLIRNF